MLSREVKYMESTIELGSISPRVLELIFTEKTSILDNGNVKMIEIEMR